MRHEQPRRAAVIGRDRRALVAERHHALLAGEVRERHVGGVAVERVGEHVGRRRRVDPGVGENVVDGDALPVGVELRPLGDAVDVAVELGARQRVELRPRSTSSTGFGPIFSVKRQSSVETRGVGPAESTGKPCLDILARRQAPLVFGRRPPPEETARDHDDMSPCLRRRDRPAA